MKAKKIIYPHLATPGHKIKPLDVYFRQYDEIKALEKMQKMKFAKLRKLKGRDPL